jgi:predicted DNA-binding transcriptional regulator AlpA
MVDRLMPRAEALETTGLSYATIWNKMRRGEFPRSVIIGKGQAAKVA